MLVPAGGRVLTLTPRPRLSRTSLEFSDSSLPSAGIRRPTPPLSFYFVFAVVMGFLGWEWSSVSKVLVQYAQYPGGRRSRVAWAT